MLSIYQAAVHDSEDGFTRWSCPSVRLSVCPFVCRQNAYIKRDFLKN